MQGGFKSTPSPPFSKEGEKIPPFLTSPSSPPFRRGKERRWQG